jgi:hypothetical protein
MDDLPDTEDTSQNDTAPSASQFPTPSSAATTSASSKRNKRQRGIEDDQLMARATAVLDSPRDDLQTFRDFVATELRALRNPLLMRQAKRGIMRISLDTAAADDGASTSSASPGSSFSPAALSLASGTPSPSPCAQVAREPYHDTALPQYTLLSIFPFNYQDI